MKRNHEFIAAVAVALLLLSTLAYGQANSGRQASTHQPSEPAGSSTALPASPVETGAPTAPIDEVPIGSGDLLEIRVFGSQDFHQEVRVTNSGEISLPLIGVLHAAGLSPKQVAQLVETKLVEGNFYKSPQITVFVKEYGTENIYVLGEVQKPGSYSILNAKSLLQAVALAGGTTPKAGKTATVTNTARSSPITVELPSSSAKDLRGNIQVMPGDTIVVSKAGVVYVIGDVRLPTGIVMENQNLTVLQAIAVAQGTTPTAALDSARLIRRGADGPIEQSISLKKMLSAETPDMKVQADDIIFVPTSRAKAFSKRGLEAVLQAVTGVVMYSRW